MSATPASALRLRLRALIARALGLRSRLVPRPARHALLLAHMRSGSTLLGHLLLQHPRVAGASERNAIYRNAGDLRRLEVDSYLAARRFVRRADLFVDQINHTRFLDDPAVLLLPSVRPVFLVRRPAASIASMVDVLGRHYGFTRRDAVAYYRERLATLAALAEALPPGRALWIRYEDLTADAKAVLAAVADHLDLPPPALTPTYPTHRFTGGAGDPSDAIRQGRVRAPAERPSVLTADQAADLDAVYDTAVATLAARCRPAYAAA